MIPATLFFTKTFTAGVLQDIAIRESLSFVSAESARVWLNGVAKNRGFRVSQAVITASEPFKGFVQWADASRQSFYWTDGVNVYRASVASVADVKTGFVPGRWETSVLHWNRYASAYGREAIETHN